MQGDKQRLGFLESIRGLAAVVVVFYHASLAFWPITSLPYLAEWGAAPWPQWLLVRSPLSAFYYGPFAVVIFFVLSGFVLSYSFFKGGRIESVQSAALRRYFRLALPVLVSVLFSYVLLKHRMYHNYEAGLPSHSAWFRQWYGFKPHLGGWREDGAVWQGLYGAFFRGSTSYDNALWTMSIELNGSFLVFAFLALFGKVRNRWLIYGICGTLLLLAGNLYGNIYLFDFLLGSAFCDAYVKYETGERRVDLGAWAWPLLLAGVWFGSRRWLPPLPGVTAMFSGDSYCTIGAALLIGVPLFSARLRWLMTLRPLALLGRVSFGLYLLHVPILCSLGAAVYLKLVRGAGWSSNPAAILTVAIVLITSIFGGWILFFIADLPSIALGHWVVQRLFAPMRIPAGPAGEAAAGVGVDGPAFQTSAPHPS